MINNYTHITVLLDRSGSMDTVREETIKGFNKLIAEHKKEAGICTLTLHQFDDEFETLYSMAPVAEARKLNEETFVPRGNTALLGAIGLAIDKTGQRLKNMPESVRPGKVIFVIITDGIENHSHRAPWAKDRTRAAVKEKIEHQAGTYKWEFIYIGANQDAVLEARDMGIAGANAINYTANAVGTQCIYDSLAENTRKYRSGGNVTTAWTAADIQAQVEAK
jgi:hypothetical protein